ncbi:MAG: hypothetical protein K6T94_26485 [Paenibacillus sp.]|nr:hypothetical protein [Paenibacillus sp.]
MGHVGFPELIAIMAILVIVPFWKIFVKAGFPGWLSLVLLIPVFGVLIIYYLAFAKWPILRETGHQRMH